MPHLPDHITHDPELIAAYAAGDATGSDLALATELVADCTDCAALHRDLRSIATALPELPAPVRARDFRLTPEQAASLAPSGWRGVLAAFASPRFRLAAPMGTGLAAIGLAGLLLGTPGAVLPRVETSGTGAAAGAPATAPAEASGAPLIDAAAPVAGGMPEAAASQAAALAPQAVPAPSAAASGEPDRAFAATSRPAASDGRNATAIERGSLEEAADPVATELNNPAPAGDNAQAIPPSGSATIQPTGSPAIAILGAAALIAGLILIALRFGARRLA